MIAENDLQLLQENAIHIYPHETVVWVGQPSRKYAQKLQLKESLTALLYMATFILSFFFLSIVLSPVIFHHAIYWNHWFTLLTIAFLLLGRYSVIRQRIEIKNAVYVLTDERILIYTKFRESELTIIQLTSLATKTLTKDYETPVGTIGFYSGKTSWDEERQTEEKIYDYFKFLDDPQEVFDLIASTERNKKYE